MTEEIVERARMFLEIAKELNKGFDRLIEITNLLKVPECGSKNELEEEKLSLFKETENLIEELLRLTRTDVLE